MSFVIKNYQSGSVDYFTKDQKRITTSRYLRKGGTFAPFTNVSDLMLFSTEEEASNYLKQHHLDNLTYKIMSLEKCVALHSNGNIKFATTFDELNQMLKTTYDDVTNRIIAIDFQMTKSVKDSLPFVLRVKGATWKKRDKSISPVIRRQFDAMAFQPNKMTESQQLYFLRNFSGSFTDAQQTYTIENVQKDVVRELQDYNTLDTMVCWLDQQDFIAVADEGWFKQLGFIRIINLKPIVNQIMKISDANTLFQFLNIKSTDKKHDNLHTAQNLLRVYRLYRNIYSQNRDEDWSDVSVDSIRLAVEPHGSFLWNDMFKF